MLHDGRKAYDEAIAAVEALAAAGRKLLVLSNSSRREAPHKPFPALRATAKLSVNLSSRVVVKVAPCAKGLRTCLSSLLS